MSLYTTPTIKDQEVLIEYDEDDLILTTDNNDEMSEFEIEFTDDSSSVYPDPSISRRIPDDNYYHPKYATLHWVGEVRLSQIRAYIALVLVHSFVPMGWHKKQGLSLLVCTIKMIGVYSLCFFSSIPKLMDAVNPTQVYPDYDGDAPVSSDSENEDNTTNLDSTYYSTQKKSSIFGLEKLKKLFVSQKAVSLFIYIAFWLYLMDTVELSFSGATQQKISIIDVNPTDRLQDFEQYEASFNNSNNTCISSVYDDFIRDMMVEILIVPSPDIAPSIEFESVDNHDCETDETKEEESVLVVTSSPAASCLTLYDDFIRDMMVEILIVPSPDIAPSIEFESVDNHDCGTDETKEEESVLVETPSPAALGLTDETKEEESVLVVTSSPAASGLTDETKKVECVLIETPSPASLGFSKRKHSFLTKRKNNKKLSSPNGDNISEISLMEEVYPDDSQTLISLERRNGEGDSVEEKIDGDLIVATDSKGVFELLTFFLQRKQRKTLEIMNDIYEGRDWS
eukprot:CAMPEP_0197840484 /NCGR_PEP_ID=MMETSP1437-20131217/45635_1 /TAXON_ID=49252 ORGANISM="Eucampia antarctica, Strain CCMP1452" /NCGR_SAMPLE_ID=MMETSP1437 /ASSEMBLY_ACC=CAM_ASM_001096 /LENGTH=510 /DNA_ID=CAMNT_0043450107 /DNA_START=36 /DNA_END=1568 /DNA_ORIENTATION=+